jgi:hypothetical protein
MLKVVLGGDGSEQRDASTVDGILSAKRQSVRGAKHDLASLVHNQVLHLMELGNDTTQQKKAGVLW